MSLKHVMNSYFSGTKHTHTKKARQLKKRPASRKDLNGKAISHPLIHQLIVQYYKKRHF
ncbi:hypothetical protein ACFVHQ_11820 [Actinomycetes bacterium NPDC127524]